MPAGRKIFQAYFSSGWVFLVPYFAVYLLHAWGAWSIVALLQFFRFLHLFHALALAWVLAGAWSKVRHHRTRTAAIAWSLAPWALLALVIYLPGVYLEMPSDPWAHLARVNDWSAFITPLANPEWKKAGSFLVYSFVEPWNSAGLKLEAFNLCAAGFSLLYYWQYFRFVRACGLSRRLAWCAVLANVLLFGNNIFGFHRYYGMSTTVLAQIGVLALARHALTDGRRGESGNPTKIKLSRWLGRLAGFGALLTLIAFNHVQGLAIAAMAGAGIWGWRVVRGCRARQLGLGLAFLALNVLVMVLRPRLPDVAAHYQFTGWLNSWYGFNLLDPKSPAFERAGQIFGLLGLINLGAGLCLVFRRPVVAWLTILPVGLLLSPAGGILFTTAVNRFGPPGYEYIHSFNRLLLGIPAGLALCCLVADLSSLDALRWRSRAIIPREAAFAFLALGLLLFIALPASAPFHNRVWHTFVRVPDDLQMAEVIATTDLTLLQNRTGRATAPTFQVMATPGVGFVLSSFGQTMVPFRNKWMLYPTLTTPVNRLNNVQLALKPLIQQKQSGLVIIPAFAALTSPSSQAGMLSGHWLPNQVALEQAGAAELEQEIASYFSLRQELRHVRIFGSN